MAQGWLKMNDDNNINIYSDSAQLLPCLIWQTEVGCCGVGGGGEQLCGGVGGPASHEEYPGWTLPGHMVLPPLRQRVGLLPLSIKGQAAGPSVQAATRGVGGLCMPLPSW